MQMRRAVTIAVVVAVTFMTFAGIARSRAGTGAIPARLTAARLQQVRFGGYTFRVPASWPVYRLDRDPTRCVRYDRHAVYLGRPGAEQQCPAHLVGRTTTISVQAAPAGAVPAPAFAGPRIGSLPQDAGPVLGDSASAEVAAALPGSSLTITGTYAGNPRQVLSIIGSVRRAGPAHPVSHPVSHPATHSATHQAARPAALRKPARVMTGATAVLDASHHPARPHRHRARHGHRAKRGRKARHGHRARHAHRRRPGRAREHRPAGHQRGLLRGERHGFDSCAAPSLRVMRAWYPEFTAAAVYLGGPESACAQPNLSASWVRAVTRMGWALMPVYVGPQASCTGFSVRITAAHAAAQGRAAAVAAIRRAQQLGMGHGTPVYYDLEAYDGQNARCRNSALAFLNAWTRALHAAGYASGLYAGASSGAQDVGRASSVYGRPLAKPDSLWFALWDRGRNLSGGPYLPADWWPGAHRIKQYLGPHLRTVRRRTVDIDSDRVYGLVYR
jgi:hypothetical protein